MTRQNHHGVGAPVTWSPLAGNVWLKLLTLVQQYTSVQYVPEYQYELVQVKRRK